MERFLYVMAGGALGSLLRYAAGLYFAGRGTFLVNITGSFLIGVVLTLLPAGSSLRLLLATGFLGGFTTFSALEWETLTAVKNGFPGQAALNMIGSVIFGLLACWAGSSLGASLKRN